jgi:hypothetical protein
MSGAPLAHCLNFTQLHIAVGRKKNLLAIQYFWPRSVRRDRAYALWKTCSAQFAGDSGGKMPVN